MTSAAARPHPLGLVPLAALLLAACSSASTAPSAGTGLSGEIYVSGSSTVQPISQAVAENLKADNPEFAFVVEGPGTGDGFALFCEGETDISDASRAISDEEAQACAGNGIEYVELQIAYDGLSVITSHDNTDVTCLSFLDLYALLGPESGPSDSDPDGFVNWSDADDLAGELSAQLGDDVGASHAPYLDDRLLVTGPGEESGTYDTFVDLALGDIAEARGVDPVVGVAYTASANDNTIIEGIGGAASTLGWVGLHYAASVDTVKLVEVDGGTGCVAPSVETVSDASYPISRPLFIYVNVEKAASNPAVAAYVDYYLSDAGTASVGDVGYVPMPEDELQATRDAWAAR